ncbi:MAG: hypothetical protein ABW133_06150 [Polyangiaceae bacterium]
MAAPYAYVVEYRVADACFPPDCRIDGRKTFGRAAGGAPPLPGERADGAYIAIGTDKDELFARRGMVLPPGREIQFTLPQRSESSVFDVSLSAVGLDGGDFRAALEVRVEGAEGAPWRRELAGTTAAYREEREVPLLGREEKYFRHVREALPARTGATNVVLRNEGSSPLGVGAPLVFRRVEGRGPRHAFIVVFDAVPYPILEQLYSTRDASSEWLTSFVAEGTLFRQATSPGQLTGSFVRRFFHGDYYRLDGAPSLFGQGFDESPPERAPGPVARLAEQGFFTQAIGANLYLSPFLSRLGFDADYNIEPTEPLQIHPRVLAASFLREFEARRDDDALFVIWYANTHIPWLDGRKDAPRLEPRPFSRDDVEIDVLDPIWANIFDATSSLRAILGRARSGDGHASRVWLMTADHGHTFTNEGRDRPWRITKEFVNDGHLHCCLATQQETRTPLVVVDEGARPQNGARRVSDDLISTLAGWRAIERRFDVDLDLPATSAFSLQGEPRSFDDGIIVSVGNSGALFGRRGDTTYHAFLPALHSEGVWKLDGKAKLLVHGSTVPVERIPSEEIYDLATDPGEKTNLAAARFGELIDMRKRMSNWLAEYGDAPTHDRYAYTIAFERRGTLDVAAPRSFTFKIDDGEARRVPQQVNAPGKVFRFQDDERPLGVVDLAGTAVETGVLVRCASSGLPLARIDRASPRFNLALARTNCVGGPKSGAATSAPPPGEALFYAELVSQRATAVPTSAALPELKRALERWGYVREK